MSANGSEPAIEYPKVTVAGQVYIVKFGFQAIVAMSRAGLDVAAAVKALSPGADMDHKRLHYTLELFTACVAHNFVRLGVPALNSEQWAARLEELEPDDQKRIQILRDIGTALIVAIGKVQPASKPVQETPAPATDTTIPN